MKTPHISGRTMRAQSRLLMLVLLLPVISGCGSEINTTYGQRQAGGRASVNGLSVLAEMFVAAGHDVRSWRVLSPSLREADVIVWAPSDLQLPDAEAQNWFARWLAEEQGRMLIYIGRDYDAVPAYWSFVQSTAPDPQQSASARRRMQSARTRHTTVRQQTPQIDEWTGVAAVDPSGKATPVTTLAGPWAAGIDPAKAEFTMSTRIVPRPQSDVLLSTGAGEPLITQHTLGDTASAKRQVSRILLVNNGSFVLNLPLVNHEHRKLAGKLVSHAGPGNKRVVFLESSAAGLEVRETEPDPGPPTGLALLGVWPIGGVLIHAAVLGLVYALACWPIFGTPRRLPDSSLTDFGDHVRALGRLLQSGGDAEHARRQLALYRQALQPEEKGA